MQPCPELGFSFLLSLTKFWDVNAFYFIYYLKSPHIKKNLKSFPEGTGRW